MALDLVKVNPSTLAEAGYTFTLCLEDGQETEAKLTVRGKNSPVVRQYVRKLWNEFEMRKAAAKRRNREVEDLSLDEAEDLAIESAAVRLMGWEGLAEGGKDLPYSKENALRILREYPFIREAVLKESDEILNFRQG